jgi:tetratricopeptide (TPR) repeat protein
MRLILSRRRRTPIALATTGLAAAMLLLPQRHSQGREAGAAFDPILDASACAPARGGPPPLLKSLVRVKTETAPFTPAPMRAAGGEVPLYPGLGSLHFTISTGHRKAQAYFDQGLRLAFGFNHAEAQRSFQAAQKLDPDCAMCWWGEALVLGPNINAPMMPEAVGPAIAALKRATALKGRAGAKERALIEALEQRYAEPAPADRAPLDAAYADAMKAVAQRFARDDTIQALHAEAAMDTQPWDYWEAAGTKPKGRGAEIVAALERVLKRNPSHPGAIHLYIHAVEASDRPERALPYAERLGALMPGAGHIVHMPAHIYYRVGLYRKSLEVNQRAIAVDERYFQTSPSDPMYRSAYYPHNIHFVMVSAQMGGDGRTAIEAALKLDAAVSADVTRQFALLEPIKAAPYTTHAQFSAPDTVLALQPPAPGLLLVQAMYHYARATALAAKRDLAAAAREIDALAKMETGADFKPFDAWGVPAKAIVQTARLVASGRVADARGDVDAAAKAYAEAIAIEDELAYMEPPYWYYPVRQSLAGVRIRQGRLDEAETALRESLARVRSNGWALAGLAEVYRLKGDAKRLAATRERFAKAWFGAKAGPDLARL